uniref:Uncharacterized protein n=1 Tax=Panagrolaimus sp. ES5 TaxID=591445 RepID=A0AC34FLG2_9BILA
MPLIDAAASPRCYPNKIIPAGGDVEGNSLRVTSVPNVFNWTHHNNYHFIIFNKLSFDSDVQYACFHRQQAVLFIKEKLSETIHGYCVTEICGNKRYVFVECQQRLFQNSEIDCNNVEQFIIDFNKQKMAKEKQESQSNAIESQTDNFFSFLFFTFVICIGNLLADTVKHTFFTYLQPLFENTYNKFQQRYHNAPTDG